MGEQPGGGSGKSYNCNVCRKDLGETIQIFRCKKHDNEILKVWGTIEGENKEKIFYQECPQSNSLWNKIPKPVMIGGIITILLALLLAIKFWWSKKTPKLKDNKNPNNNPEN